MPAVSEKQREAIAIAEHHPDKLYAKNRGLLSMKKSDMHDFAATKGLKRDTGTSTEQHDLPGEGAKKDPAEKLKTRKSVAAQTGPGSPTHKAKHMAKAMKAAHADYKKKYATFIDPSDNPFNSQKV